MTDNTELEQLRRDVDELKRREDRREGEHRKLLLDYELVLKERETLRRELEQDYEFLGKSVDARMSEFTQALAGAAPSDWQPALLEFARLFSGWTARHMERMLDLLAKSNERHDHFHQTCADGFGQVFDRLDRLEGALFAGRVA